VGEADDREPWSWRDVTPRDWVTDMGWPVVPEGLTDTLVRLTREYAPPPLLVTENGAATVDAGGAMKQEPRPVRAGIPRLQPWGGCQVDYRSHWA
jgi:hypothetical protein